MYINLCDEFAPQGPFQQQNPIHVCVHVYTHTCTHTQISRHMSKHTRLLQLRRTHNCGILSSNKFDICMYILVYMTAHTHT